MGASINAYFPGMTEEQLESQPGFWNDDNAWANWMAECDNEPAMTEAVRKLDAAPILTFKTDGMEDEDVGWVTPQQLRDGALKLRDAIKRGAPETEIILKVYEKGANRIDPVQDEFLRDLDDIVALAEWGEQEGAKEITLEVNW
jgi:hypothetical protein